MVFASTRSLHRGHCQCIELFTNHSEILFQTFQSRSRYIISVHIVHYVDEDEKSDPLVKFLKEFLLNLSSPLWAAEGASIFQGIHVRVGCAMLLNVRVCLRIAQPPIYG